jgi:hypothetical protein
VKQIKAKIIILCRADLFDRLPGPNKNKIKRDSGIILDWHQDVKDLKSTNLVKLINLRAKIALNREVDVFGEFFPPEVAYGNTVKVLLDNTRHTPRDIIQLLNEIQKHTKKDNPSVDNISNGIRTYSIDYFVGEIIDELNGFLTPDEVEDTIQILGTNGKSHFKLADLEVMKKNNENYKSLDLPKILTVLFNCSAIGNSNDQFITFKYRNRHASINCTDEFIVHNGLRKGLNLA